MKSLLVLAASLFLTAPVATTSQQVAAAPAGKPVCKGFLPENDLKIPVGWTFAGGGGLSEAQFNEVIDKAIKLYGPVIAKQGATLIVDRKWTDATVNASAQQFGTRWMVNMYGGLARHPVMTREGFALVICHELGHHIGGAPKIASFFGDWATNEGGADYFSGLKCLRRFFADEDNEAALQGAKIPQSAIDTCKASFADAKDQLVCLRSTMAGLTAAALFQVLRKESTAPSIDTPDKTVVNRMFDDHPDTQCRLDTYFAGDVCNADVAIDVSDTDYTTGSCTTVNGQKVGVRPLCWFKP